MNEVMTNIKNKASAFWSGKSKKQKYMFAGSGVLLLIIIAAITWFAGRTNLVPLYSDLSPSETGTIKETLDSRGIESAVEDNGTTILVPEESVDTLKVELAADGIPDSGSIDYSFFGKNAGLGMTENEFDVLKLDATQTELANLIKKIDGIEDASVMINVPEKTVFASDSAEEASASIVLKTKAGYQFKDSQVKALYHLVSKSIPNLPEENVVITNQNFEYFDLKDGEGTDSGETFASQHEIKKEIERDVQRQVQSMLGTLMGQNKVVVSVTADVDFTQEKREENLVTPVDEENMEGIAISAQRLNETYSGKGASAAGGVPESEDSSDSLGSSYTSESDGDGDYEKVEETINSEVNRIKKEIVESPYKVKDLGIQVMVEPPTPDNPNSLSQQSQDDIVKVLGTIIRTTLGQDEEGNELTDEQIDNKVALTVQEFNGKADFPSEQTKSIPMWIYIVGGVLVLVIIVLLILFLRSRRRTEDEYEEEYMEEPVIDVPDLEDESETEASIKRKQLEKMAKEKPDEFAKLLRSWIAED